MKSISWNDMNDDSDVDHISSDQEHQKKAVDKNKIYDAPPLQKTVSSPQQLAKSQKFDNNSRITQNLQKLAKHTDSKVWLYLAEFPNRQAEVNQILNQNQQFEKINSLNKGWNVLVKTQTASKYIEKGLYQKGILLKFIYSNKNESRNQPKQTKRIEKKYSQKYRDNKGSYDQEQIVSPKIKSRQTYNDRTNYQKQKQYSQGGQKKKVKYVAKNDLPKKIEEVAQPPNSPNQDSKQRNQAKQIQKVSQIVDKLEPVQTKPQQVNSKQKESETKNGYQERDKSEQKDDKDFDKDQKSQSEQSQQKEKKKKLKKKNKSKGNSFVDKNNPFSALF